jgi:UPF0755 protein
MRRRLLTLLVLFAILAPVGLGVFFWMLQWMDAPIESLRQPTVYEVQHGATVASVAKDLAGMHVLERPDVWRYWARWSGQAGRLKAGEYQLTPGLSPRKLADLLTSGLVIQHAITFIEGSTYADLRNVLRVNGFVRQTLGERSDADIMHELGAPDTLPEGQFFPDTYSFPKNTTDIELLRVAYRRMQAEMNAAWSGRDQRLDLKSAYDALILASIVEKESALERERPIVAGVFIERLDRGMRLQTDPTVIYGMGATYSGNITRADLLHDTPYNTYTRTGLPPTPICLPGAASLRAATHPAMSGALYFVATGDGDGGHHFSATLAEHNAAVKRYLERLRAHP